MRAPIPYTLYLTLFLCSFVQNPQNMTAGLKGLQYQINPNLTIEFLHQLLIYVYVHRRR